MVDNALPFAPGTATDYTGSVIGIAVYKSTDAGQELGPAQLDSCKCR